MRGGVKDVRHVAGKGILEVHRPKAEKLVDGSDNAAHTRVPMGDGAGMDPGTGDYKDAPMCVDVIDTALCVVLRDEHGGILPDRRMSQKFDYPAEREIVVGHIGRTIRVSICRANLCRVI